MKSLTILLGAAAALVGFVSAQAGISQCVLTCSQQAATSAGCASFADRNCVCTSAAFQSAAQACLAANCTAEEQTSAITLQNGLCGSLSVTSGTVSTVISSAIIASASGVTASIDTASLASSVSASATSASATSSAPSSSVSSASAAASSSVSSASKVASSSASVASASPSPSGAATSLKGGLGSDVLLGMSVLGAVVIGAAVGL